MCHQSEPRPEVTICCQHRFHQHQVEAVQDEAKLRGAAALSIPLMGVLVNGGFGKAPNRPNIGAKSYPDGSEMASNLFPKWLQMAPRNPQEPPGTPQEPPGTPQEPARNPQDPPGHPRKGGGYAILTRPH